MGDPFTTDDPKLAAFLALRGYGEPTFEKHGSCMRYLFLDVQQGDVLTYYNGEAVLMSPFALFKKHHDLVGRLNMSAFGLMPKVLR